MTAVTTTRGYGERRQQLLMAQKAKEAVVNRMMGCPLGEPAYYAVCYYGKRFKPNPDLDVMDRWQLSPDELRKRWDRGETCRTHKTISNFIHKSFGDDVPVWWFLEKHNPETDEYGNKIKDGHYHSNLFVGTIPDLAIEEPSPHLMPLFYKEDEGGIPINMRAANLETLKLLLLNACIRQAKWVGQHPDSLFLSPVPAEEMEQTISYCMKEIDEKPESFNRVIDRKNSFF